MTARIPRLTTKELREMERSPFAGAPDVYYLLCDACKKPIGGKRRAFDYREPEGVIRKRRQYHERCWAKTLGPKRRAAVLAHLKRRKPSGGYIV